VAARAQWRRGAELAIGGPGAARLSEATILVCTFNDEQTIGAAVESALAQTAPARVLVVDDGSTDGTPGVLARYHGIRVARREQNRGLVFSCNEGLSLIETPFYVRLDGDDALEPGLVAALLGEASSSGANVVYTDRWEVMPDGSRVPRPLDGPLDVAMLVAAGTLFPAELVRSLGGYRDLFWEEFDLYLRLLESGGARFAHVPEPLYSYTVGAHGRMTSSDEAAERGWRELREIWPAEVLERYGLAGRSGVPGR
jgi:glycosyltransferase involved in cell wall biosynthesis